MFNARSFFVAALAVAVAPAFVAPAFAEVIFDTSNSVNLDGDMIADISELGGESLVSASLIDSGTTILVTGTMGANNGTGSRLHLADYQKLPFAADAGAGRTFELTYNLMFPTAANFRRDVIHIEWYNSAGGKIDDSFKYDTGSVRSQHDVFQSVTFTGVVPTNAAASANFRLIMEQTGTAGENGKIDAQYKDITFDVTANPVAVPEPASTALIATGAMCLLAGRRRRSA